MGGDSGVARGADHLDHTTLARQLPYERVLPGTAADHEYLHRDEVNSLPDKGLERSEMKRRSGANGGHEPENFFRLFR